MKTDEKDWLIRVKSIYNFHIGKLRDSNTKWTMIDSSKALGCSVGLVSESILIGTWLHTHSEEIEKFEFRKEALEYLRSAERRQKMRPLL